MFATFPIQAVPPESYTLRDDPKLRPLGIPSDSRMDILDPSSSSTRFDSASRDLRRIKPLIAIRVVRMILATTDYALR